MAIKNPDNPRYIDWDRVRDLKGKVRDGIRIPREDFLWLKSTEAKHHFLRRPRGFRTYAALGNTQGGFNTASR